MVEQQFKKSTAEIPGIETRKVSRVQLFFTFHIISHVIVDVHSSSVLEHFVNYTG